MPITLGKGFSEDWVLILMSKCAKCGLDLHPDQIRCELCGEYAKKEKRNRNGWIRSSIQFGLIFVMVLAFGRVATGDVQVGLSDLECSEIKALGAETRQVLAEIEYGNEPSRLKMQEISLAWQLKADDQVAGKYSWSDAGREHDWLQRLANTTEAVASRDVGDIDTEGLELDDYLLELTKLSPRYCPAS